jgi:hypothetical protein
MRPRLCYRAPVAKPKVVKKVKARSTARRAKRAPTARSARRAVKPRTPAAPAAAAASAPSPHDELAAPRDIPRLTRYGERFGPHKIDTRILPQQLPIGSPALALFDPTAPESWRVLARPVATGGNSRVMLSIARGPDERERAAALLVYVGHSQIARWTVANHRDHGPARSADQLPRCPVTSGWLAVVDAGPDGAPPEALEVPAPAAQAGTTPVDLLLPDGRRAIAVPCGKGELAAYWAVDAADKAVCLVIDFDAFTQKEWKAKPA